MKRALIILSAFLLVALLTFALFVVLKVPSNNRAWNDSFKRLAQVSVSPDKKSVSFTDIRDWRYDEKGPTLMSYVNQDYHLDSITGMQFLVEPFPDNPVVGHTFLVFTFSDAPPIAFSIEARIQEGQKYSGILGLFNTFELSYTWGTEEDFITRRTVWLGHDLYRYDISIPLSDARFVFLAFAEGTEHLATHPMFYNTLLHNCTNELARLINLKAPGTLPWDWSRILTGTADKYLFNLGYIKGSDWETVHANAKILK